MALLMPTNACPSPWNARPGGQPSGGSRCAGPSLSRPGGERGGVRDLTRLAREL
jgi:hypothetical protein